VGRRAPSRPPWSPSLYVYTASVIANRFPTLRNKRICLLIAHPDDEAMFFAPTLLALTRPDTGNHVKILCLSTGNQDGLGDTRREELKKSAKLLGLRDEDDALVLDDPNFQDSITATWDTGKISTLLCQAFAPHLSRKSHSSGTPPLASIDVLLTFDAGGVSGHPNHTSLYHGARRFISALTAGKPNYACPVDLYTLTTVGFARKYGGFLDVFATIFSATLGAAGANLTRSAGGGNNKRDKSNTSDKGNPGLLVAATGLLGGRESAATARQAMTQAHQSQMVWFRWGWITLSRYMYINELRLENGS
ncbi:N-acetylglucosaminyl-phosphatidylinositol de-N-acetylase, partial [Apiospora kogelbergensis]|uniref:N-acetylglucosaminyl-phosphatidylinositol de-N-acetylase n=1 Tax=Apiospora kogelbergensis TaxID=1337665 RepID=UPI00312F85F4